MSTKTILNFSFMIFSKIKSFEIEILCFLYFKIFFYNKFYLYHFIFNHLYNYFF